MLSQFLQMKFFSLLVKIFWKTVIELLLWWPISQKKVKFVLNILCMIVSANSYFLLTSRRPLQIPFVWQFSITLRRLSQFLTKIRGTNLQKKRQSLSFLVSTFPIVSLQSKFCVRFFSGFVYDAFITKIKSINSIKNMTVFYN